MLDAAVLATVARGKRVLEFGAGGSTQIFAQVAREVVTVESDSNWVEITRHNVARILERERRLAPPDPVGAPGLFLDANVDLAIPRGSYDVVFIDSLPVTRPQCARMSFDLLADGGCMVFHDTRVSCIREIVTTISGEFMMSVGAVMFDIHGSNLSSIVRGRAPAYENWNEVEEKLLWEIGLSEPPNDFIEIVNARIDRFFR